MINKVYRVAFFTSPCLLFLAMVSSPVFAQGNDAAIKVGEADLVPAIRLDYLVNNNAYLTAVNETEVSAVRLRPTLALKADRRLLSVTAEYAGDYGLYSEDNLEYFDHQLNLGVAADPDSKKRIVGTLALTQGHEPLGENLTRGIADVSTEQIEFSSLNANGEFTYGARDARGNLALGINFILFEYSNQDALTNGEGYVSAEPYTIFSYRLSSDARALLELRYASVDFDDDFEDKTTLSTLAGITLGVDRKTSGSLKVGVAQSDYDLATRDSATDVIAEIGLKYAATSYSEVDLGYKLGIDNDSLAAGSIQDDSIIVSTLSVDWNHNWSSRVRSRILGYRTTNERDCQSVDTDVVGVYSELSVSIRRWISVGANAGASTRGSSSCNGVDTEADFDYDRQIIGVHMRVSL